MITHQEPNEVLRGNVGSEQTFSIKASSKAFQILSGGLYSDKILAIVRELCCNAYDAHVSAGNPDTPIEIKLPTLLDPTFYVKDFGTGLSHEQICSLYTTYFDSTKTDSNDYIGALGLGSKSPFSYVSTFSVESRYDGTRRVYSCFINEAGLPSITQLGEEPTDEPNGLTISLSAKKDDSNKFYNAARKALMYFNPLPIVIGWSGFKPYSLEHTVVGSNWKIRVNDYYASMTGPHVVQGFVAYPIDGSLIIEHGLTTPAAAIAKVGIDFAVNIGDVDVAASREALSYDVRTIKNLVAVFEQAATEMRASFQKSIDACTTKWETAQFMSEIMHNPSHDFRDLFHKMHKEEPFMWNGTPITNAITADMTDITDTNIICYQASRTGLRQVKRWSPTQYNNDDTKPEFKITIDPNVFVITDTVSSGNKAGYATYYDTLDIKSLSTYGRSYGTLIVVAPKNKTSYNQIEIEDVITRLGNPPYKTAAELGIIKQKVIKQRPKRDKQERLIWQAFPIKTDWYGRPKVVRSFGKNCWGRKIVDLDQGGFYVPIERFTINGDGSFYIDDIIKDATTLGFISDSFELYGFREAELTKLPKDHKWLNFFDYVTFKFDEANQKGLLTDRIVIETVKKDIGIAFAEHFIEKFDNIKDRLNDGNMKTLLDKLHQLSESTLSLDKTAIEGLQSRMTLVELPTTKRTEITDEWKLLYTEQYEMIQEMNLYNMESAEVERLIRYINLVEKNSLTSAKE